MAPYPFTNEGDQWVLHLDDYAVVQICFDYSVTLNIGNTSPVYFGIGIANRFSFMDAGKIHAVDVNADPFSGSALLALRNRVVHEIAIAPEEGVLHIRFAGDAAIVVEANPQYEAWQLVFSEAGQESRVICMPGGGLSIWSPSDERESN